MARSTPLAPMIGPDGVGGGTAIRSPKTAELVAGTLRRMVVDGQLKDGDFLPNEAELMAHFGVSRPTLREAVRVLESERLVEVRRGSRTGARVRVPGPEIVARPAGLLLELSGATIADLMMARAGIEPMAARCSPSRERLRSSTSWTRCLPTTSPPDGRPVDSPRRRVHFTAARRAVRQCDAGDHRRNAARDHRAAHRIRLQGRPTGIQGGLREAHAVLSATDATVALSRRCGGRGPLAQAPRRCSRSHAGGARGRQGQGCDASASQ